MPRESKSRKVCCEFLNKEFYPKSEETKMLSISVEEIEAIRLCDYERLEQSEAASIMHISRGTLQRILYSARLKTAQALCEGLGIRIEGGNYEVKPQNRTCNRGCKGCMLKVNQQEQ